MNGSPRMSTPIWDRVLTVTIVVVIFFVGTDADWILGGRAFSPAYLLSVLLVVGGLMIWLVGTAIDHDRPSEQGVQKKYFRVQKPYLAEVFIWSYVAGMFVVGSSASTWLLVVASCLIPAMGLAKLLYAKGVPVW